MKLIQYALAACLTAGGLSAGCGAPGDSREAANGLSPRVYAIRVGDATAMVELASTPEERRRGLSGRESLPDGRGMLFVFGAPAPQSFWMKDTYVALDIAFITPDGRIAEIVYMAPDSLETHTSKEAALLALEMSAGWFEQSGVRKGDLVVLPDELAYALRPKAR